MPKNRFSAGQWLAWPRTSLLSLSMVIMLATVGTSVQGFDCPSACHDCSKECRLTNNSSIVFQWSAASQELKIKCQNTNPAIQTFDFNGFSFTDVRKLFIHQCNPIDILLSEMTTRGLGEELQELIIAGTFKMLVDQALFQGLDHLAILRLRGDHFTIDSQNSPFANLQHLRVLELLSTRVKNYIMEKSLFVNLGSLEHLTLDGVEAHNMSSGLFDSLKNLRNFTLNRMWLRATDIFQGLAHLKELHLVKVKCQRCENAPRDWLASFPSLRIFEYSPEKSTLLPPDVFHNTPQLRSVSMIGSQLPNHDLSLFTSLSRLSALKISSLNLQRVNPAQLPQSLRTLAISPGSWNSSVQGCDFLREIEQLRGRMNVTVLNCCSIPENQTLGLVRPQAFAESQCSKLPLPSSWWSSHWELLSISIFVLVGGTLCLLYCIYQPRRRYLRTAVADEALGPQHSHDVFISYAHEDGDVAGRVVARFKEAGIGYIHHEEHFEIGDPIVANIERAVTSCRITLLVLSNHYLKSPWCIHELVTAQTCHSRVILLYRRDQTLDPATLAGMPQLRDLIRTRTYLVENEDYLERLIRTVQQSRPSEGGWGRLGPAWLSTRLSTRLCARWRAKPQPAELAVLP